MPGKRVQFDDETWHALDLLAKDRMQDFQELADEAFADLLKKHGRPTDPAGTAACLEECQATRDRDAIYAYLTAVYGLVSWWTAESRKIDRACRALHLQRMEVSDREEA
jgi:hypothetical protein